MVWKKGNAMEAKEKNKRHIPGRFIVAMSLIILETALVLGVVIWCTFRVPYFYLAVIVTQIYCVLKIINSEENPDYKVPWLLFVIVVPVIGFMIYIMFYDRKLSKTLSQRLAKVFSQKVKAGNGAMENLEKENKAAFLNAKLLCKLSGTNLYQNTKAEYFDMGEKMFERMLEDLKHAEKFIFMEYFIVQEGKFWNSILDILKEKAAKGVDVRVVYDDIGCMTTLPGDYYKTLQSYGIKSVPFQKLRGQANNDFNNRSHRKILVIDGKVGYTGGVNIADEYINEIERFGVWKDVGIRLKGEAVTQLTSMCLCGYEVNVTTPVPDFEPYFAEHSSVKDDGYMVPFGDGPRPIFEQQIAKTMIMNMLAQATEYVYMMSPYLIIDNELCQAIENAAMRGIDVCLITPHIPDKKMVFKMTRSHYHRLMEAGVKVYEYEPGFVHAKVYLSDDSTAIVGTINLDYRSLVHHFENGIWLYKHEVLKEIKQDFENTMKESIKMNEVLIEETLTDRFVRAVVKTISPML